MGDNSREIFRVFGARISRHIQHLEVAIRAQICDCVHDIAYEVVSYGKTVEMCEGLEVFELLDAVIEETVCMCMCMCMYVSVFV